MNFRLLCMLFFASAASVKAQSREFEIAAGVTLPSGALRERRKGGPLVRAAIMKVDSSNLWRLRLDGQVGILPENTLASISSGKSTLSVFSAMVDLIATLPRSHFGPYLFVGGGLQVFNTSGLTGGTSTVAGVRGGFGMRLKFHRVRVVAEAASTYAFTDRGTTGDVWLVNYRPVSLGLSF